MRTVVAGRLAAALVGLLATLGAAPASAAVQLQPVLAGLDSPLYVAQPRDGSGRLFVVEQPGRIKLLAAGSAASGRPRAPRPASSRPSRSTGTRAAGAR